MIPLAPSLVIAAANALVGVSEEGGVHHSPLVQLILRDVHQEPEQPWCAAFVHHVGHWALYDHAVKRSSWPLPPTAGCRELGDFAKKQCLDAPVPQFGDVFLQYTPELGGFGHTGFIERVQWMRQEGARTIWTCATIEGQTTNEAAGGRGATLRTVRDFCAEDGDRFVRWVEIHERRKAA